MRTCSSATSSAGLSAAHPARRVATLSATATWASPPEAVRFRALFGQ